MFRVRLLCARYRANIREVIALIFQPKVRYYDFRAFGEGRLVEINKKPIEIIIYSTALAPLLAAFIDIADYLVIGVFMFSGAAWMFGHRTKAIELLIGGSVGYLIIRHAGDMQAFLESIS